MSGNKPSKQLHWFFDNRAIRLKRIVATLHRTEPTHVPSSTICVELRVTNSILACCWNAVRSLRKSAAHGHTCQTLRDLHSTLPRGTVRNLNRDAARLRLNTRTSNPRKYPSPLQTRSQRQPVANKLNASLNSAVDMSDKRQGDFKLPRDCMRAIPRRNMSPERGRTRIILGGVNS